MSETEGEIRGQEKKSEKISGNKLFKAELFRPVKCLFATFCFLVVGTSLVLGQETQMQSPYEGIEWEKVMHIPSVTHFHGRGQRALDNGYMTGIRHFAFSNYYPSAPVTLDEKVNQHKVLQTNATFYNNKLTPGPFRWNNIIMDSQTGWAQQLPEKLRAKLPFKLRGPIFSKLPKDVILSPNAEHHNFLNTQAHINSLGSKFSSGNFDARGKYQLPEHGYPLGVNLDWQVAFRKMIEQLILKDGGGIIINHPRWSRLKHKTICNMLDFDKERVLGIEVWNHTTEKLKKTGWSKKEWDAILATGRRCFGFFASDHVLNKKNAPFLGRNILLVNKMTEAECLRAYRQGRFYGALKGSNLRFESLEVKNGTFFVKTNRAKVILFISQKGIIKTVKGKIADVVIPKDASGKIDATYLRVEAYDDDGEIIFSQAIMLRSGNKTSLAKKPKAIAHQR